VPRIANFSQSGRVLRNGANEKTKANTKSWNELVLDGLNAEGMVPGVVQLVWADMAAREGAGGASNTVWRSASSLPIFQGGGGGEGGEDEMVLWLVSDTDRAEDEVMLYKQHKDFIDVSSKAGLPRCQIRKSFSLTRVCHAAVSQSCWIRAEAVSKLWTRLILASNVAYDQLTHVQYATTHVMYGTTLI
jgi:hypothetical protein